MAWKQTTPPRKLKLWTPVSKDRVNWDNQDLGTYSEVTKNTFPLKIILKETKVAFFSVLFSTNYIFYKKHIWLFQMKIKVRRVIFHTHVKVQKAKWPWLAAFPSDGYGMYHPPLRPTLSLLLLPLIHSQSCLKELTTLFIGWLRVRNTGRSK